MLIAIFFLIFALIFRLLTLVLSQQNEAKLIELSSIQYGAKNSKIMSIFWILFYFGTLFELITKLLSSNTILQEFSGITMANYVSNSTIYGITILIVAFAILLITIKLLGPYYIVKLYKTPGQKLSTHWLYKYVKHPIYYLVLIPELIGILIMGQAYVSFVLFGIVCFITVIIRIIQENKVIKEIKSEQNNNNLEN